MKKLSLVLAIGLALALTGCCNLRGRSCPVKPCLANPCAVAGACKAPAPMPMMKPMEK